MDILFAAIVEGVIEYVDEKYGRAAAWFASAALLGLPIALVIAAVWWIAS